MLQRVDLLTAGYWVHNGSVGSLLEDQLEEPRSSFRLAVLRSWSGFHLQDPRSLAASAVCRVRLTDEWVPVHTRLQPKTQISGKASVLVPFVFVCLSTIACLFNQQPPTTPP